jgi:hypothetical protein
LQKQKKTNTYDNSVLTLHRVCVLFLTLFSAICRAFRASNIKSAKPVLVCGSRHSIQIPAQASLNTEEFSAQSFRHIGTRKKQVVIKNRQNQKVANNQATEV